MWMSPPLERHTEALQHLDRLGELMAEMEAADHPSPGQTIRDIGRHHLEAFRRLILHHHDMRPYQRWMSASGVCSCSRISRLLAWRSVSHSDTVWAGCGVPTSGSVLMNRPIWFSMPGISAGRPETVTPAATAFCPVRRCRSSSQAA